MRRNMSERPEILYEDNHIVVALKPPGVPSQADAGGDLDMLTIIKRYIKQKYNKPGEVFLGLVHRLDRPTGGIMVFARTSKAAARLSDELRRGGIDKTYLAVCEGLAEPQAELTDMLIKDRQKNISRIAAEGEPGAKRAELSYTRLAVKEGRSLISVELKTGRSHQIRVQLSSRGLPLSGDVKYSGKKGALALFAAKLSFTHPTKKTRLLFKYPPNYGFFIPFQKETAIFLK